MESVTVAGQQFLDMIFTIPNMMVMGATWALVEAAGKFFHASFATKRGRKVKEGLPILLASTLVWLPGALPDLMTPAERVFVGAILGMATEWLHQKVKRVLLGGQRAADQ